MKTNFRNIVAVSAITFAGVFSANASVNNSELVSSTQSTLESINYRKEAQMINSWIVDMAEAKATMKMMGNNLVNPNETIFSFANAFETETIGTTTDLTQEAQQITKLIADKEEAKAIQKVIDKGFIAPDETISMFENEAEFENNDVINDFGSEARLMTRILADKEEAKAIQRLIAEGKIAVNE